MEWKRFALALGLALALARGAAAEAVDVVRMDFLPGWQVADGVEMGGLRIRLEPGWKTYWRAPGDAGIPPTFHWTGSENLRAVRVHWPAPEVFDTAGLRTIGYSDEVVLPVELFAADPARPISVRGEAALGVCKDICIPAHVSFAPASVAGAQRAIETALAARPRRETEARVTCTVAPIGDGLRLTAQVVLPHQGGAEVALIELGRADIWVSEATTRRDGPALVAVADLVPPEAAPFALDRSTVRLTVLGRDGAVDLMGCVAG